MNKVFKYQLDMEKETQNIVLPQGYKILDVQMQWSQLCLWALVNPEMNDSTVSISIYVTGENVRELTGKYIGTFQCNSGAFVGHVFED